jgi:cobalt-zinc-cadmium efflux system membrane fusion protein
MTRHLILTAVLALSACNSAPSAPPATDTNSAKTDRAPDKSGLQVTAELQRQWGVTIGQASRTTSTGEVTLSGVLRLDEQHTAQISSLLDGQVVSIGADLGATVRRGQVLATIHAPALAQAKTAFLQAASKLELARREDERARTLLKQEAIDQKEALRRRTDLDNAFSELGVAETHLHSFGIDQATVDGMLVRWKQAGSQAHPGELADPYLTLTSPIDGQVIARDMLIGQHIEPDKPLFTIAELSVLWAVLDAREADLPRLTRNGAVRITTSVYPDRTWNGRIIHIGDVVDEKSRTVKVRVETRNEGRLLKPNMFIQGEVPGAASPHEVLVVPEEAIQTFNGDAVVFVRTGPTLFAARAVELGARLGTGRIVLRGLDGSETIAVAGTFNLKAEWLKASLSGE